MKFGTIPGIAKPVSRLAQGTMMISLDKRDYSFALLDSLWEAGFNTFDTAHVYGGGSPERVFGEWIASRNLRDKVVILGKGAHPSERSRVTPEDITADMNDSLERMQVEMIDLYVLHRDDPSVQVGPIVEALNAHQQAGRISAFGGSNWTYQRIREANDYANTHGLTPFAVSSPNFSLAEQVEEPWGNCVSISGPQGEEARNWYAQDGIALFTWSSLAGGFLSGQFQADNLDSFAPDDSWAKECLRCYGSEPNFQRLDRARELASAKGVTVPQIALAYVLNQPQNIFALVGCANAAEVASNASALDITLTSQEQAYLDLRDE